jgi:tetratricopeptide (TPR) repeat protein
MPQPGEPSVLAWPLDAEVLEDVRWYLEDYLRAPFGVWQDRGPAVRDRLAGWGGEVFGAVFGSGAARDAYVAARERGMEVVFRSASAGLLGLPWELMRDPARDVPLAVDVAGVDRSLLGSDLGASFGVAGGRLRVLMVISRPAGAADVGFQMIARPLLARLEAVRGSVDLVVLRPPTLEALERTLRGAVEAGEPFQVVHFDGHGALAGRAAGGGPSMFGDAAGEGVLVFQDEAGGADGVPASRVGQVLAGAGVPVVVLNACQSGAIGKQLEAAVATRLLRGGASSVVAMAYSVYAVAAAEFMAAFYERLFAGDTVSVAVAAGRRQMFRRPDRPSPKGELPLADWLVPVHYLRREVSFPGLVTARAAGEPSLEQALDRLRDPGRGDGGDVLAPVGVFTGRDALFLELETAARLQRVVVVHGPAGTGKTELAKAFGRWWRDTGGVERPGWVFWHSFEPGVASFGLDGVISQVGLSVFGPDFARLGDGDRAGVVEEFLRERRALLIWDNFETVASMPDPSAATPPLDEANCAELAGFLHRLAAGGSSAVLVTSRTSETWLDDLGDDRGRGGELRRIGVGGLLPSEAAEYADELLAPYPAAAPRRADRAFGELMEWLDGHPLSMRLILPHLDTVSAQVLLAGLRGTTPLPGWDTGQPGTALRAGSLAASLAYSYTHLGPDTRRLLPAVSLFEGVADADVLATFSAAEGVPGRFAGTTRDAWAAALDQAAGTGLLTGLGRGMYRIHPALPAYLAALWQQGSPDDYQEQRAAATEALLEAYAAFGDWLLRQIGSGDARLAFTVIGWQQRTMGTLLGCALDTKHWAEAQDIGQPLDRYWDAQGRFLEGDGWADRVRLAVEDAAGHAPALDSPAGALWLFFAGAQASRQQRQHRLDAAERTYRDILAMLEAQPSSPQQQSNVATACHQLGLVAQDRGRLDEAQEWYAKSLAINEELGDRPGMAHTHHQLGMVAQLGGRLEEAQEWYARSLAIKEDLDDRPGIASSYHQLGRVAQDGGQLDEAQEWYARSLAIEEELGDRRGMAGSYHQLGNVAYRRGRLDQAQEWYARSLAIKEEIGNQAGMALSFGQFGLLAEARGQLEQALEWMVRCVTVFGEFPHPATGPGPEHLARLTAQLGMSVLEECWQQVTGGPLPQAVRDYVAAHPDRGSDGEEKPDGSG